MKASSSAHQTVSLHKTQKYNIQNEIEVLSVTLNKGSTKNALVLVMAIVL